MEEVVTSAWEIYGLEVGCRGGEGEGGGGDYFIEYREQQYD